MAYANTTTTRKQQQPTYQTINGSNITYIRGGDINDSKAECLLVGVNTTGNMHEVGGSLADTLARKHKEIVPTYQLACQNFKLETGKAMKVTTRSGLKLVLLAIWHLQIFGSKPEWVENALKLLVKVVEAGQYPIKSLATVKLGCGGPKGLNWDEVGLAMCWHLGRLGIPVEIYIGKNDKAYFPTKNEAGKWEIVYLDPAPEMVDEAKGEVFEDVLA